MSLKQNDVWLEHQKELQEERKLMKTVFLAWQETGELDIEPFPLFNIDAPNTPRDGSTVSLGTLKANGIKVPDYPSFVEWKQSKSNQKD
jgi:hypothetical protein